MPKKIKLKDLKVQSFVTDQDEKKFGGLRALAAFIGRDTEQTPCYVCDSAGLGCSAPCY